MCECADVEPRQFEKRYKSFYFMSLIRTFAHPHIRTLKKAAPYVFLIILLVVTLLIVKLRGDNGVRNDKASRKDRTAKINGDRGFDRRTSMLEYTRHARCRMDCRSITQAEVQDIMKNGRINYRKSNVKANPCPVYALEGYTDDNQHVRVVLHSAMKLPK